MQFVKVFLGPSGWGVTVYKLSGVCTCVGFMYNLLKCVCPISELLLEDKRKLNFVLLFDMA